MKLHGLTNIMYEIIYKERYDMTGLERTEHVIDEKGVCMEKYYDSQGRLESTTSDQRVTKIGRASCRERVCQYV